MRLTNVARAVVPKGLRAPLRRWLYPLVPLDKRMGKEYWRLKRFLQEAQWWDRERIEAWQLQKLREMVRYAYDRVPGYHALYADARVKPDDIASLEDIRFLPLTTKELFRDNLEDFTAKGIPSWRLRYCTTGGSTGTPFGFYHTEVNSWVESAFMHSGWERAGWRLGDTSAVLRGGFIGSEERFWDYDPVTRELLLSSYHLTEGTYPGYLEKIEELRPRHLQAYPSAITILADLLLEHGDAGRIGFQTILLGSENIYEWQKRKLSEAFPGARMFGWYGLTEQAILGPMCEHSDQYHIWPFYGFTEMLNEKGEEVEEDETGELAGTSFWNYATPFIRYRTMDMAQKGKCGCDRCGRQFQLIQGIQGRMQDYVITRDRAYVTLTALIFAQHFRAFGAIKKMQLYQDRVGEVTVRIVPTDSFSEEDASEIRGKMEKAVGGRIRVEVILVDDIPRTLRGKYRFLEQKLSIPYREQAAQEEAGR